MKRRHPALESPEVRSKRAHLRRENARYSETLEAIPKEQWPSAYRALTCEHLQVFRSRHFLVQVVREQPSGNVRLSVNRTALNDAGDSWEDGITWDELMQIKRQCGYASHWASEIYPPDHETVNVANLRHLWLLPEAPAQAWVKKQH